jgi:hypothetical protein
MEDCYPPPSSNSWPFGGANCDMPPEHSLKASPDSRFYRSTSPGSNPARAIKVVLQQFLGEVPGGGGSIFVGEGPALLGEHGRSTPANNTSKQGCGGGERWDRVGGHRVRLTA